VDNYRRRASIVAVKQQINSETIYIGDNSPVWRLVYNLTPIENYSGKVVVSQFTQNETRSRCIIEDFATQSEMDSRISELNLKPIF
jgi:hypothetical protein